MGDAVKVAVINLETGLVENTAVVTEGDGSTPGDGYEFVPSDDAAVGDTWDGQQIIKAPAPESDLATSYTVKNGGAASDDVVTLRRDLDALAARLTALENKPS